MSSSPLPSSTSGERLKEALHNLLASASLPPSTLLSSVSSLPASSLFSLCSDSALTPLVDLLLSLDERHLPSHLRLPQHLLSSTSPDLLSSPADEEVAESLALRSVRSSCAHLHSSLDHLRDTVQSSRETTASYHRQLNSATATLSALQEEMDSLSHSSLDCLPRLLPSVEEVGEWSDSSLLAVIAMEEAVQAELQLCMERRTEPEEWEQSGSEGEEELQAEVNRLAEALQSAQRNAVHAQLRREAAAARLERLKEQRNAANAPSPHSRSAAEELSEDQLQSASASPPPALFILIGLRTGRKAITHSLPWCSVCLLLCPLQCRAGGCQGGVRLCSEAPLLRRHRRGRGRARIGLSDGRLGSRPPAGRQQPSQPHIRAQQLSGCGLRSPGLALLTSSCHASVLFTLCAGACAVSGCTSSARRRGRSRA